jgi:hypothetical protein
VYYLNDNLPEDIESGTIISLEIDGKEAMRILNFENNKLTCYTFLEENKKIKTSY